MTLIFKQYIGVCLLIIIMGNLIYHFYTHLFDFLSFESFGLIRIQMFH